MNPTNQSRPDDPVSAQRGRYAVPSANRKPACLLILITIPLVLFAFALNGVLIVAFLHNEGFIYDKPMDVTLRNAEWFDRPYKWIAMVCCLILNGGYLMALRKKWHPAKLLVISTLNVLALVVFHTLVSMVILHG